MFCTLSEEVSMATNSPDRERGESYHPAHYHPCAPSPFCPAASSLVYPSVMPLLMNIVS